MENYSLPIDRSCERESAPTSRCTQLSQCLLCLAGFLLATTLTQAQDKQELRGRVTMTNGQPVPAATVIVLSAKPREGPGTTLPNTHPDSGKRVTADDKGEFVLPELDPELLYRLLVLAPGCRPAFIDKADPLAGVTRARLRPAGTVASTGAQQIIGRVVNPEGRPVPGALVEVEGVDVGSYTTWGGGSRYLESTTITDDAGFFSLNPSNVVERVNIRIEAPGLAKHLGLLTAGQAHFIRLRRGTAVTGRLLHDGKPMPDVTVAAATQERSMGESLRGYEVATDGRGQFTLPTLAANREWSFFAKMESLRDLGLALPLQKFKSGADGSTNRLGDLTLVKGHLLRGRVVLSDGKPIKGRVNLNFSRNDAYDTESLPLDPDGQFELAGVPEESITLSVRLTGYRVSKKNPSKDWYNEGTITGILDRDYTDFVLQLEPGKDYNSSERPADTDGSTLQPSRKPLRSAQP